MTSTPDGSPVTTLTSETTWLLTAMPDAVIVCDETGQIVFANANVTHLLGYGPEELMGKRVEMLVPGTARSHHTELRKRYMRRSATRPMSEGGNLEASHKSGKTIPVSISLNPMTESGQSFVIAAIRDETKDREASAALKRVSEEQAALAEIGVTVSGDLNLENVYDRVADQIGNLLSYDRLAISLINHETDDLVVRFTRGVSIPGHSVGVVVSSLDSDSDVRREWRSNLEAEPVPLHSRDTFGAIGLSSWIQVPLGTEAGGAIGYISLRSKEADAYSENDLDLMRRIAIHITPAIQNALACVQTVKLAEERERSAELEAQARELARLDRERSRFLTTVSHELKTPLTSLVAFADVLARNRDSNLTGRQRQQIEVMRRSARRLDVLIDDLLDVSRMDADTFQVQLLEFDGQDFFDELTRSFVPLTRAKNQRLLQDIPQERLWFNADRNRMAQVITNLVSNASKYSSEGSDIELDISRELHNLIMRVRDHGIGISAEDQRHLFSPFFRADNEETRSVDGTGLGLFIVKTIIELHGGTVTVESEKDAGTAVTIICPCLTDGPSDAFLEAERAATQPSKPKSRLD